MHISHLHTWTLLFTFCSHRCSQILFPTAADREGWNTLKTSVIMYFCVNANCTQVYTGQVYRQACLCTHQSIALVWFSIKNWAIVAQALKRGFSTSGTQTRPLLSSLCYSPAGSSFVQTPSYEHHIPYPLVTVCCGLACVHANSIKVNKCIKPCHLVSSEHKQTGRCICHERKDCGAAARLHLATQMLS